MPVGTAYDQWTQLESFPQFMEGVTSVHQVDGTRLEWDARIYGRDKHWEARIDQQEPDRLIAWHSTTGASNHGRVSFEPVDGHTRIRLRIDADPDGVIENVGDHLGLLKRQVHQDLEQFREFIESSHAASGGWRGQVREGQSMGSKGDKGTGAGPRTASAGSGMSNAAGTTSGSDVTSGIDSTRSSDSSLASDMTGGGSSAFRGTDASVGSSLAGTTGMTAGGGMPVGTNTLAGTEPTTGPTGGTDGSAGTVLDETAQTGLGDLRDESSRR